MRDKTFTWKGFLPHAKVPYIDLVPFIFGCNPIKINPKSSNGIFMVRENILIKFKFSIDVVFRCRRRDLSSYSCWGICAVPSEQFKGWETEKWDFSKKNDKWSKSMTDTLQPICSFWCLFHYWNGHFISLNI